MGGLPEVEGIQPPLDPFLAQFYEDYPGYDRTTFALGIRGRGQGEIVTRAAGVISGVELCALLPRALSLTVEADVLVQSGARIEAGTRVAILRGEISHLLALERTLLNALMVLSGVATATRRFVNQLPPGVRLLDTRKTIPGLTQWVKKAVRDGGGYTHRYSLADQILIKDNHIAALGSLKKAVALALNRATPGVRVICEVRTLKEAEEAHRAGVQALLIDNVPPEQWPKFWERLPPSVELEFSGGIREENLRLIPRPPRPIWISTSAFIMSAQALDLAFELKGRKRKSARG